MRRIQPTGLQQAARLAVLAALKPYADQLGGAGLLAILAYTVGQTIAMMDQTTMTPENGAGRQEHRGG